jgi:hypothetical protein
VVFDVGVAEEPTLLQALELKGGGLNALMRQAVAALLNYAHPDIEYEFSQEDEVITHHDVPGCLCKWGLSADGRPILYSE